MTQWEIQLQQMVKDMDEKIEQLQTGNNVLNSLLDSSHKTQDMLRKWLRKSNAKIGQLQSTIKHCNNCGGSWVDDGINSGCHCEELKQLRAIVAKLPNTADGVSVVPGMEVVWLGENGCGEDIAVLQRWDGYGWTENFGDTFSSLKEMRKAIRVLEVAKAAKENDDGHAT